MNNKKIGLIAILLLLGTLFYAFDLNRFVKLSYIKENQILFADFVAAKPLFVASAFFVVYVHLHLR